VSSISLAINYPTLASVPHSIINGFKNLLAIAVATDIDFAQAEAVSLPWGFLHLLVISNKTYCSNAKYFVVILKIGK